MVGNILTPITPIVPVEETLETSKQEEIMEDIQKTLGKTKILPIVSL